MDARISRYKWDIGVCGKSKMAVCNRNWLWNINVYLDQLNCIHDRNEIPMATYGVKHHITGLIRKLFHGTVCIKCVVYSLSTSGYRPPLLICHRTEIGQYSHKCSTLLARSQKHLQAEKYVTSYPLPVIQPLEKSMNILEPNSKQAWLRR